MTASTLRNVALAKVFPDPANVRKTFEGIDTLAASIKARGILTPITVREAGKKLIIVDGERRYRAAKKARLKTLTVVVQADPGDVQRKLDQVAVNSLREGLRPLELGRLLVGLRKDHKLSDNQIAAHLDKQGIPALTKGQMAELMQLVDLPGWAQDLVDAGKLEPKAAPLVLAAAKYPEVLKAVRKGMENTANWRGSVDLEEAESAVADGFANVGAPDLGRTEDWQQHPVRFDPTKACKGCEHLVSFAGNRFCMNKPHFDELQAQAKEAGLGAGGKKPQAPRGPGPKETAVIEQQKAERKGQAYSQKLQALLHRRLQDYLVQEVAKSEVISSRLVLWLASRQPNGTRFGGQQWFTQGEVQSRAIEEAVEASDLNDLVAFLNPDLGEKRVALARAVGQAAVRVMSWRQVQAMALHLKVDIEKAFRVDADYLAIQSLDQLKELGRVGGLEGANTRTGKALREDILSVAGVVEKLGVPPDVGVTYRDVPVSDLDDEEPDAEDLDEHQATLDEAGEAEEQEEEQAA